VHQVRRSLAGLVLLGVFACWGVALVLRMALSLSLDTTLIIFFGCFVLLALALGGKTVDVCSSWFCVNDEGASQGTEAPRKHW
jgi:cell division protein FtsW (lipid II flippase)